MLFALQPKGGRQLAPLSFSIGFRKRPRFFLFRRSGRSLGRSRSLLALAPLQILSERSRESGPPLFFFGLASVLAAHVVLRGIVVVPLNRAA